MLHNKYLDLNYFEDERFKILIHDNIYPDKFYIYYEDSKIIVERFDKDLGWGQNLKLSIFDKISYIIDILIVGSSSDNIKIIDYKKDYIPSNIFYQEDTFKIYSISEKYNDIFKVDYIKDLKSITVKRIDSLTGWGQDLKLKYIEKCGKVKIINIGASDNNIKTISVNIDKIKYKLLFNTFETENYKIDIINDNKLSDIFNIIFYEENNTIYIKRVDKNDGWGQNLKVSIYDINNDHNFTIYIGASVNNEIYKTVDLTIRKCYVALTTIPSRIKLPIFIENIKDFLNTQTYPIENMFITVAKKYKRFTEVISNDIIYELQKIPKVIIINIEEDFGPASKYLGPLIHYYDILQNNLLIVIDDDRKYNPNLIKHFYIGYNSYPNITFSSGLWKEYFNPKYSEMDNNYLDIKLYKENNNTNKSNMSQGLGGFFGFCIKVDKLESFIKYNLTILDKIEKSFFHDEGIILGYLKYREEVILYLKHRGCNIIKDELVNALCISNLCDRGLVEKQILNITNNERLLQS